MTRAQNYVIGVDPAAPTADKSALVMMTPTGRLTSSAPQAQPMPSRGPRMAQSIREALLRDREQDRHAVQRADFVRAFFKALDGAHGDIDMDLVIDDPSTAEWDLLDRWIFGPVGEFTGFARVNLMEDLAAEMRQSWMLAGGSRSCAWNPRSSDYKHVTFYLTCLYHPDLQVNYGGYRSRYEPVFYVRFATYADYAEWARIAAQDDYRLIREIG